MSANIWEKCSGTEHLRSLDHKVFRVVEAQHISSTRKLVDSEQEHEILEILIERTKPHLSQASEFKGLHYLLFTPFRYPPLRHGSRFGKIYEPSLWYGSLELETAFTEVAYYRFYFLQGTSANLDIVSVWHTAFTTEIFTQKGMNLTISPFIEYKASISSPIRYEESQEFGSIMRSVGVEAFLYCSARRREGGVNVGIYSPSAFKTKKLKNTAFQSWQCLTTHSTVEFFAQSAKKGEKLLFRLEDFYVDGKFPNPAG